MTDNEIIKAMQCVIGNDVSCSECEYQKALPFPSCRRMCAKNALDLINRQNAEIERLDQESGILEEELEDRSKDIYDLISKERSNAIIEFAEALKQESEDDFVSVDLIDSVVKDMTEVEE